MHDLSKIKSAVAQDPLPFLNALYLGSVRRTGNSWRVGSKGGRCFDTHKGELLCVTFNGDAGQGDCIEVWKAHHQCDFATAVEQIAALYHVEAKCGTNPVSSRIPRPAPSDRLAVRPPSWPLLKDPYAMLWHASLAILMSEPAAAQALAEWRGWPVAVVPSLARGEEQLPIRRAFPSSPLRAE